jgi:hypothetical protein
MKESLNCLTLLDLPSENAQAKTKAYKLCDFVDESDQAKRHGIFQVLMKTNEKDVFDYILSDPPVKNVNIGDNASKENYRLIEKEYNVKNAKSLRLLSDVQNFLKSNRDLTSQIVKKNTEIRDAIKVFNISSSRSPPQIGRLTNMENFSHFSTHEQRQPKKSKDAMISAEIQKTNPKNDKKVFKYSYFKKMIIKVIYKKRIKTFLLKCSTIELFYKIVLLRQLNDDLVFRLIIGAQHKAIFKATKSLEPLKELEDMFNLLQESNFGQKELIAFNKRFSHIKNYIEKAYAILSKSSDKCTLLSKAKFVYRQMNFKILSFLSTEEIKARFCSSNSEVSFTQKQMILHEKMIRRTIIEDHCKKLNSKFKASIVLFYKKLVEFAAKNRCYLRKMSGIAGVTVSESLRISPIHLAKKLYSNFGSHKDCPKKPVFSVHLQKP